AQPRPDRGGRLRDRSRPRGRGRGRPGGRLGDARRGRALEGVTHGALLEGTTENQQRTTDNEPKTSERNGARTLWTEHSGGVSIRLCPRSARSRPSSPSVL